MKCRCEKTTRFLVYVFHIFCCFFFTILGVFLGTLGSLKMSISSRRNTDFHVFYLRKCDLEIGTRKNSKKLSFWKDFGVHFCDFFFLKRVLKSSRKKTRKKVSKKLKQLFFWGEPAECAVAWERLERGQKSKIVRILEKVIGKEFFKSSFVISWISIQHARPFPTGRAAERCARSAGPILYGQWSS